MKNDKVLERLALENRKAVLIASKHKIKNEGITIQTNRGFYKIRSAVVRSITLYEIYKEINEINKQLEELTGLNQDKMDYLNREV